MTAHNEALPELCICMYVLHVCKYHHPHNDQMNESLTRCLKQFGHDFSYIDFFVSRQMIVYQVQPMWGMIVCIFYTKHGQYIG